MEEISHDNISGRESLNNECHLPNTPKEFINDPDFERFKTQINEHNYDLFVIAATIKDKKTKNAVYEIASLVYDNEFKTEVLKLLTSFKDGPNSLLKNEDFYVYLKDVNKFNLEIFTDASNFNNEEAKRAGYKIAAHINNKDSLERGKEIFEIFKKGIIPIECFNEYLLTQELLPLYTDDKKFFEGNNENILFENLCNNEVLYGDEIDITNPSTYKNIPEGTLCYHGNVLYIRKNGGVNKLKLSKDKFVELFPSNSLITFSQGKTGNCYFLSAIYALLNNVIGRERVLNCFSTDEDGNLLITFPYKPPIVFKGHPILNGEKATKGSLGWRYLEEAYILYKNHTLDKEDSLVIADDKIKRYEELDCGNPIEIYQCFGFYNTQLINNSHNELTSLMYDRDNFLPLSHILEEFLKKNLKKQIIICLGSSSIENEEFRDTKINKNHVFSLLKYEKDKIYISNPYNTSSYLIIDENTFNNLFDAIYFCVLSQNLYYYESTLPLNYKRDDEIAYRWWAEQIDKIEDKEKSLKLLEQLNISDDDKKYKRIEAYETFHNNKKSPYILLNDDEILKFEIFWNVNKYNLNLFLNAARIKDRKIRILAYDLVSKIDSTFVDTYEDNLDFDKFKSGLSSLFIQLENINSNILEDLVFYEYFKNLNTLNVSFFLEAAKIPNPEARQIAYTIASKKTNYTRESAIKKLFKESINNPHLLLNDSEYMQYFGFINTNNNELFDIARDVEDDKIRHILYEIASKVKNEKDKQNALELYRFILDGNNIFDGIKLFSPEKDINENNLGLYLRTSKISNHKVRKVALYIATKIKTKNGERETLELFDSFEDKTSNFIKDEEFFNEPEICQNINDNNIVYFNILNKVPDKKTRLAIYPIKLQADYMPFKEDVLEFFNSLLEDSNNLFILNDPDFSEFRNKLNEFNLILFAEASKISSREEKIIAYKMASLIHSKERQLHTLQDIKILSGKIGSSDSKSKNEILRYIDLNEYLTNMNTFNLNLMFLALKTTDDKTRHTISKIASHVISIENQIDANDLINSITNETQDLLIDEDILEHIDNITSFNISHFARAAKIKEQNERRIAYNRASQIREIN